MKKLVCSECGEELKNGTIDGFTTIVEPCENCLQFAIDVQYFQDTVEIDFTGRIMYVVWESRFLAIRNFIIGCHTPKVVCIVLRLYI